MLPHEQKSVGMLRDLVQKFSKPGDLITKGVPGMLSTLKTCLLLDKHGQFVGYDKDSGNAYKLVGGFIECFLVCY